MLPDLPQTEAAIVEMTNTFRRAQSLQAVKPNAALQAAAKAFADYLARSEKFTHQADGRKPEERVLAQGYSFCVVAENLAWNLDSRGFESRQLAREVVEGWKLSPSHRENLLLQGATDIGVAVVRAPDKNPKYVSVQMLGRPESLKVTFSVQNQSGRAAQYTLGGESETIEPGETITHTDCNARQIRFDDATRGQVRFAPRDGNRFIVRSAGNRGLKIDAERR